MKTKLLIPFFILIIILFFLVGCSSTSDNKNSESKTIIYGDNTIYRTSENSKLYGQDTILSSTNSWFTDKNFTDVAIYLYDLSTETSVLITDQYYGETLDYKIAKEGYYYIYSTFYNLDVSEERQVLILTNYIENKGTENLIEDGENGTILLFNSSISKYEALIQNKLHPFEVFQVFQIQVYIS
jgi:hypothetical protein